VTRRLLLLIGGALGFWLLVGLPAHAFGGGDRALVFSGAAVLLCLPPMIGSLVWAEFALKKDPQQQLVMVLGGTALRICFVLAGGLALYLWVPYFQSEIAFWIWVMVVYPVTLALDVGLILAGRPPVKA
jgi:hypothetical protein